MKLSPPTKKRPKKVATSIKEHVTQKEHKQERKRRTTEKGT